MSHAAPAPGPRLWLGVACAAGVLLAWTSFILVGRVSARGQLGPFDLVFVRFAFAGLVVLPLVLWRGRGLLARLAPQRGRALARAAALAATAGVGYCSFAYSGFFLAPVSHAVVLMTGALPLYTAVLAALLVGERFRRARVVGLLAIVAGNLLVGGGSIVQAPGGDSAWKGDLLFAAAAVSWALYSVLCRRWKLDAVPATCAIAIGCLASYLPLFALGAVTGLVPTKLAVAPWSEILFQAAFQGGFSMLLAGLAFTQVVKTFGPVRTTMVTAVVPVLAMLLAWPLLGEPITPAGALGLACVTLGLWVGVGARSESLRNVIATTHTVSGIRPVKGALR